MAIINTQIKGQGGVQPVGTLGINTNGVYDVTNYANADVQVPQSGPDAYIPRGLTTSGNDVIFGIDGITETMVSTKTATIIGEYAFSYAFYSKGATSMQLPNISLPNVVEIKDYAFQYAFYQMTQHTGGYTPTFSAPHLTTVGLSAFYYAFYNQSPYISYDFSSVTTAKTSAFYYAFSKNTTSIDFRNLTTVESSAFSNSCRSAFDLATFRFDGLTTLNSATNAFSYCLAWTSNEYTHTRDLDISFPALTTINNCSSCFSYFAQNNKNIHSLSFPELTSIDNSSNVFQYAMNASFYKETNPYNQGAISFPKLTSIKNSSNAFSNFAGNNQISAQTDGIDFSKLEVIYSCAGCFNNAFYRMTGLQDANGVINVFPKLRLVSTTGSYDSAPFYRTFASMGNEVRGAIFPELLVISGSGQYSNYNVFSETFYGANSLTTIEFPKVKSISRGLYTICGGVNFKNLIFGENIYSIGTSAIIGLFPNQSGVDLTLPVEVISNEQSIIDLGIHDSTVRFPVLVSANLSSISQLLGSKSNNTIHFPIRMQSTVSSMSGYPNFGGTNTTVLFDIVYQVNDGTEDYVRFHDGYNNTSYMYQHDYIVGANGVTYYRMSGEGASYLSQTGYVYTKWTNGTDVVSTLSFEPTVGEEVHRNTTSTIITTVASYVPHRVYVPNTAEPQVGDTLYSDAACTTSAGTISSIV